MCASFRVFSLNFEGDKLSPWPFFFFKGQFQLQCRIGAMAWPGSNPDCRKGFKNGLTIQPTCHRVAFSIKLLEWGHPLPGYWRSENSDTVGRDLKMGRFLLYQA